VKFIFYVIHLNIGGISRPIDTDYRVQSTRANQAEILHLFSF